MKRQRLPVLRDDHFHDECGVVGVWGHNEAATLCSLGLHALQHRGQEGAGIVSSDGTRLHAHRAMGLVSDVFGRRERLAPLVGNRAIGHVRYSTAGGSDLRNVQPLLVQLAGTGLAVAHNGNLVHAPALRDELEREGAIFQATTDTEVVLHLIARSRQKTLVNRIVDSLRKVEGAWSLLFLSHDQLIAARDPYGLRPLVLGLLPNGAHVVASETCALDLIEAAYVRDVEPGEVLVIDDGGVLSFRPFAARPPSLCVFEYVYFARPDTSLWGRNVYEARIRIGDRLAREQPADVDVIIPVPDSGTAAALGYARAMGIPFEFGLMRNHYVGRSFIEPSQQIRDFGVKLKLNPLPALLAGKRVAVVDDSLVRGTTCRKIVRLVRAAGAKEVHLRLASPPTVAPCFYGIDTPSRQELIAANQSVEEIREYVGADSLAYLSLAGLHDAVHGGAGGFCDACFSNRYPIPTGGKPQLPLFDGTPP